MAIMPVERGKVREYAVATGAAWPAYLDDPAAPIPPTFLSTVVFWENLSAVFDAPEALTGFAAHGIDSDVGRLLSVEQEYVFDAPPPHVGEVLDTSLRFDGISVKEGRRGGRMLFVSFAVEFADKGGRRAECRYTSAFLTGQVAAPTATPPGNGPRAELLDAVPIGIPSGRPGPTTPGTELPPRRFGPVTMTDIVRYQGASGDLNPMHHDDDLARAHGYPAAFSVGMLGAGYLATYCCERYGTASVRRFRTRFGDLVWRGDTLVASARVARVFDAVGERRVELAMRLTTDAGGVAVTGSAEFAVPA